ncbi:hypothetical protein BHM03_00055403 [Ensete ventricosum]|nr:hypothetical protein BHM03_00055403 [Ensete ventricosum]
MGRCHRPYVYDGALCRQRSAYTWAAAPVGGQVPLTSGGTQHAGRHRCPRATPLSGQAPCLRAITRASGLGCDVVLVGGPYRSRLPLQAIWLRRHCK